MCALSQQQVHIDLKHLLVNQFKTLISSMHDLFVAPNRFYENMWKTCQTISMYRCLAFMLRVQRMCSACCSSERWFWIGCGCKHHYIRILIRSHSHPYRKVDSGFLMTRCETNMTTAPTNLGSRLGDNCPVCDGQSWTMSLHHGSSFLRLTFTTITTGQPVEIQM